MRITAKMAVSAAFFILSASVLTALDDLERSTDVVKIKSETSAGSGAKVVEKKTVKKSKGKKANYVFKKQDETSYKFDASGHPIKEKAKKKPVRKSKKKINYMMKDYKNQSQDTPFKTYKFDEEGNPVKEKPVKKKTGKEEKLDNDLELGNESKKINVTE